MTVDRFLIRGVGSLDMPLRVLDRMSLQGVTVYRTVIDKEGDDYCVQLEEDAAGYRIVANGAGFLKAATDKAPRECKNTQ